MYCVAIDLGGTFIKIGLIKERILLDFITLSAHRERFSDNIDSIETSINSLLHKWGVKHEDLRGIGLAFPGMVNPIEKKVVSTNSKYDDAVNIDLSSWVYDNWRTFFVVDNDARLATVGEWQLGSGENSQNMVMMTIGTGIGTGVILDGRMINGCNYHAGSLGGHMIVDYRGRRCTCGNIGCVEAMASSFFLSDLIQCNPNLSSKFKENAISYGFKELFTLKREGDKDADLVCRECMNVWAAAIINYIYAYDPEVVVLGGGIMRSADIIIPYLKERIDKLVWSSGNKVKIKPSLLGDNAALFGISYNLSNPNNVK